MDLCLWYVKIDHSQKMYQRTLLERFYKELLNELKNYFNFLLLLQQLIKYGTFGSYCAWFLTVVHFGIGVCCLTTNTDELWTPSPSNPLDRNDTSQYTEPNYKILIQILLSINQSSYNLAWKNLTIWQSVHNTIILRMTISIPSNVYTQCPMKMNWKSAFESKIKMNEHFLKIVKKFQISWHKP